MKELILVNCWQTVDCTNIAQVTELVEAGFTGMRIFIDLGDLPFNSTLKWDSSSQEWQLYINHCFATMPDGLHAWTHEGRKNIFGLSENMRDAFDMCQKCNWLPIVCMGYREEGVDYGTPYNWLATSQTNRAPKREYWTWLGRFAYEFGFYLKYKYKFQRSDLEIWNEPSKMQGLGFGWDSYVNLSLIMGKQWKKLGINYKLHVFADDILNLEYLTNITNHRELMNLADYLSVHIGVAREDSEWDSNLLWDLSQRLKILGLKIQIAVTEMAVNGIWSRFEDVLLDNIAMCSLILAMRKEEFGTALRIDDIWLIRPDGSVKLTSQDKKDYLAKFVKDYGTEAEIIMEYIRPDELQAVYDAFGITTPYNWATPNLYVVGKKDPNKTITWADVDALTETQMKMLVKIFREMGKQLPNYPNIKYNNDGSWNSNWQNYAKSKPKI